jgi:N-terminal domain of (some) glycogen debranching enzymes
VSRPWTFVGEQRAEIMAENSVTLVEGSTFCISEASGDILPGRAQGLFVRDTRVLSGWQLTIDHRPVEYLTVHRGDPYTATYISRVPPPEGGDARLLITRRRYIGDGMREDITIANITQSEVTCLLALAAHADFADLFEVKESRVQPVDGSHGRVDGLRLTIGRRRGSHEQSVIISADTDPIMATGELR